MSIPQALEQWTPSVICTKGQNNQQDIVVLRKEPQTFRALLSELFLKIHMTVVIVGSPLNSWHIIYAQILCFLRASGYPTYVRSWHLLFYKDSCVPEWMSHC